MFSFNQSDSKVREAVSQWNSSSFGLYGGDSLQNQGNFFSQFSGNHSSMASMGYSDMSNLLNRSYHDNSSSFTSATKELNPCILPTLILLRNIFQVLTSPKSSNSCPKDRKKTYQLNLILVEVTSMSTISQKSLLPTNLRLSFLQKLVIPTSLYDGKTPDLSTPNGQLNKVLSNGSSFRRLVTNFFQSFRNVNTPSTDSNNKVSPGMKAFKDLVEFCEAGHYKEFYPTKNCGSQQYIVHNWYGTFMLQGGGGVIQGRSKQIHCNAESEAQKVYDARYGQNEFKKQPEGARLAMTEMAFNLGSFGFSKFRNFMELCNQGKFYQALDEEYERKCAKDEKLNQGCQWKSQVIDSYKIFQNIILMILTDCIQPPQISEELKIN